MSIHNQNLRASPTIAQSRSVLNRRVKGKPINWVKRGLEEVESGLSTQSGIGQQQESTSSTRIHTDQCRVPGSRKYPHQPPGCFQTRRSSYMIPLALGLNLLFASGANAKAFTADFQL